MFGWKLLNAFLMGFMLSAKISQQVRTTLVVKSSGSERSQTQDKFIQSWQSGHLPPQISGCGAGLCSSEVAR